MTTQEFPFQDQLIRMVDGRPEDIGSVYIIKNEYLRGVVKIGMTRRSVAERIANLSTAHPGDWKIVDAAIFSHVETVEMMLHRHFNDRRTKQGREFFHITDGMAVSAMNDCRAIDGR